MLVCVLVCALVCVCECMCGLVCGLLCVLVCVCVGMCFFVGALYSSQVPELPDVLKGVTDVEFDAFALPEAPHTSVLLCVRM